MSAATSYRQQFRGLFAATLTPYKSGGAAVDLDAIDAYAELLVKDEVAGIWLAGTSAECMSLTVEERQAVAERWVNAARGRFKIIAHIGHNSVEDSKRLARHAAAAGVDAIACVGPSYHRPSNAKELVHFMAEVAAAAPDKPFFYYHFPKQTGISISMFDFFHEAIKSNKIPNLAGAKCTSEDLYDYAKCLPLEGGKFALLYGHDTVHLGSMAMGGEGTVGISYSCNSPLHNAIIRAFDRRDIAEAQRLQQKSIEFFNYAFPCGLIVAHKYMLRLRGLKDFPLDVRPPFLPATPEQLAEFDAKIRGMGLLELLEECRAKQ